MAGMPGIANLPIGIIELRGGLIAVFIRTPWRKLFTKLEVNSRADWEIGVPSRVMHKKRRSRMVT